MVRNWYIPAFMYLIFINNQIATLWNGDNNLHRSWSGALGFPNYYHYWYLIDFRAQLYICFSMIVIALKFPPKGKYLNYGITCLVLNAGIAAIEDMRYMYHANNAINERLYPAYLLLYTFCIVVAAFYHKIFNNGFS